MSVVAPVDGQGTWLVAAPMGLLRSDDGGKSFHWQCSVAFGSGGKMGLGRRVFPFGKGFLLLEDGQLQESANGCDWDEKVDGWDGKGEVFHVDSARYDGGAKNVVWAVATGGSNGKNRVLRWRDGAPVPTPTLPATFSPTSVAAVEGTHDAALIVGNLGHKATMVLAAGGVVSTILDVPQQPEISALTWRPVGSFGGTIVLRTGSTEEEAVWVCDLAPTSQDPGKTEKKCSWSKRFAKPPGDPISAAIWLPTTPTPTLYVGGHEARVWRSDDLGVSFQHLDQAPHAPCLFIVGGKLHACADGIEDEAMVKRYAGAGNATWDTVMCLGKATGAAKCGAAQAVCEDLWKYTLIDAAAEAGTCKPVVQVVPDVVSGEDADGGTQVETSIPKAKDTTGAGGDGGGISTAPPDDGCSVQRNQIPDNRRGWIVVFLLCVGVLLVGSRKEKGAASR